MTELISTAEAARLLDARPDFVHQMIAKGRLKLLDGNLFDKSQVLELKELIGRLRGDGIATMVQAADAKPDPSEP